MEYHCPSVPTRVHCSQDCCHCYGAATLKSGTALSLSQCKKCHHSSALIAALWQRISLLECQIFQISTEKQGAENVVRTLLHSQTPFPDPTLSSAPAINSDNQSPVSLNQSFTSSDTFIETTPTVFESPNKDVCLIDQPLIDFSDHIERVSAPIPYI